MPDVEISPEDRIYDLVTELLIDGVRARDITEWVSDAITQATGRGRPRKKDDNAEGR